LLIVGINVYTGLMGSGKSYEVVAEVIVPAIAKGRRVVTNVDGIDGERVAEFIRATYSPVPELLGEVVHVTNGDIAKPDSFHITTIRKARTLIPSCSRAIWYVLMKRGAFGLRLA